MTKGENTLNSNISFIAKTHLKSFTTNNLATLSIYVMETILTESAF